MSAMKTSERNELRRIIKGRFDLLDKQIRDRLRTVQQEAGAEIMAEFDQNPEVKALRKKVSSYQAKLAKLEAEKRALVAELEQAGMDFGVRSKRHEATVDWKTQLKMRDRREAVPFIEVWSIRTVALEHTEYNGEAAEVVPGHFDSQVARRTESLRQNAGHALTALMSEKLDLEERLAVGALESEDARDFLSQIPTAEQLLGLDAPAKALVQ